MASLPITMTVIGKQVVAHFGAPRLGFGGSAEDMLGLARRIRTKVRQVRRPLREIDTSSLPMRVMICLADASVELHFYQPMRIYHAEAEIWLALADSIQASAKALRQITSITPSARSPNSTTR